MGERGRNIRKGTGMPHWVAAFIPPFSAGFEGGRRLGYDDGQVKMAPYFCRIKEAPRKSGGIDITGREAVAPRNALAT